MMARSIAADLLKIRRKGLWFLVFLAPLGLTAMQALNFGLRYDYLTKVYADDLWGGLIDNVANFVPLALIMGATLLSSMIANVEHMTGAWKQLLALPVSRAAVFAAKLAVVIGLLAVSCLLLSAATACLGIILSFGEGMPVLALLKLGLYPLAAALPVVALECWVCVVYRNQALPVTMGLTLAIGSLAVAGYTKWIPLAWPVVAWRDPEGWKFAAAGAALALVVYACGQLHFNRRDVA
ncbi:ABC transporter permease [Paenibacillus sp. JX-17]|uniref:ABC transporter permease n=1 Tax=Paenibacillus lacisoli TaxID=3064525 RepID=A0ABT9CDV7_9BACL|nr:ABC transporter permease [Paenibacillus sp. JX-17]MDO7906758.1 ABC transporter permease [Paenibacillus sp. JX-17]